MVRASIPCKRTKLRTTEQHYPFRELKSKDITRLHEAITTQAVRNADLQTTYWKI